MVSENLKEWVKEKRKKGISDERIKKSLEETGHDPSIVDELENPFESDSSDVEPSEDLFNSSDSTDNLDRSKTTQENTNSSTEPKNNTSSSQKSSESNSLDLQDKSSKVEDIGKEKSSSQNSKGSSFEIPSFSFPSAPSISRRKLAVLSIIVLVLAGGAAFYNGLGPDLDNFKIPDLVSSSEVKASSEEQKLASLDSKHSGCPDAGVRIQSVSSSNGKTTANVLVTRNKTYVVLKVMRNGELQGFSTKNMVGESQISVDAVGDQAELRPLGCEQFYSRRSY